MLKRGEFASHYYEKAVELLKEICIIPAPSNNEDKRVSFILDYLKKEGIDIAFSDEAKNVIIPFNDNGKNELDVFAAHTDVVFPDTTALPMRLEGDKLYCPGSGDNTASFVALLLYAIEIVRSGIKTERGILFVCNSAEEGLGNLKGVRKLFEKYGKRIRSFTTFDACLNGGIVNTAVGSERYLIKVKTEGGHSFKDFGNKNAIAMISSIITELYAQEVDDEYKTTFNVGTIEGGTSVNTIAENAECTYEFRSINEKALSRMRHNFEGILARYEDYAHYECIGIRPCSSGVDTSWLEAIAEKEMTRYSLAIKRTASSTDANIPLSLGIPAICIGIDEFSGAHTRSEYVNLSTYATGLNLGYDYILSVSDLK